jgi:hypothetical protein
MWKETLMRRLLIITLETLENSFSKHIKKYNLITNLSFHFADNKLSTVWNLTSGI